MDYIDTDPMFYQFYHQQVKFSAAVKQQNDEAVTKVVSEISQHIKETDPRFGDAIPIGSAFCGLKTGTPNEYDFNIPLVGFGRRTKAVFDVDKAQEEPDKYKKNNDTSNDPSIWPLLSVILNFGKSISHLLQTWSAAISISICLVCLSSVLDLNCLHYKTYIIFHTLLCGLILIKLSLYVSKIARSISSKRICKSLAWKLKCFIIERLSLAILTFLFLDLPLSFSQTKVYMPVYFYLMIFFFRIEKLCFFIPPHILCILLTIFYEGFRLIEKLLKHLLSSDSSFRQGHVTRPRFKRRKASSPMWTLDNLKCAIGQLYVGFQLEGFGRISRVVKFLEPVVDVLNKLCQYAIPEVLQTLWVEGKSSLIHTRDSMPHPEPGEVYFHLNDDEIASGCWSDWTCEGDLVPALVRNTFKQLLRQAEEKLSTKMGFQMVFHNLFKSETAITCTLRHPDLMCDVHLDFAPVIPDVAPLPDPNRWDNTNSTWPKRQTIDDLKKAGVSLAPRSNFLWKISTSTLETILVQELQKDETTYGCRGVSHRIVKRLTELHFGKVISSYVLKNVWFWECAEYPNDSDWEYKHQTKRIHSMVQKLHTGISNGHLPSFFCPDFNLLQVKTFWHQMDFIVAKEELHLFLNDTDLYFMNNVNERKFSDDCRYRVCKVVLFASLSSFYIYLFKIFKMNDVQDICHNFLIVLFEKTWKWLQQAY